MSQADQVASTPFQSYGSGTNADGTAQQFVAPVNAQQTQGINATNTAATEAQPYYGAAVGTLGQAQANTTGVNQAAEAGTAASAAPITGQDINGYMSPYLGDVLGTTNALANQNNSIAQSGALGTAINSGAFGGDRTGIAAANLNQQNSLAEQSTDAGILNQGYNTALSTAETEQQAGLQGSAQLASIGQTAYGEGANTASEMGALGTGAQTAGLQGANAQIGAGTVEQQTAQAQDTAEYNQFLQQESFPFQKTQWLGNLAEGTGALSGSTTTTSQPGGFFSDRRLKRDIKKVGKTFSGDDIVTYKMGDDPRTRMGLIAQDIEKKNPHAVGLAGGFKTLDYGKATEKAAKKGGFAAGGAVDVGDYSAILAAQQQMYAGMGGSRAMAGGAGARVPQSSGSAPQLVTAQGGLRSQPTGAQNVATTAGLFKEGQGFYKDYQRAAPAANDDAVIAQQRQTDAANNQAAQATMFANNGMSMPSTWDQDMDANAVQATAPQEKRGGRIQGFASGGSPYSGVTDYSELDIPDVNSHNQLAKAPDLPKQSPTGFQQLMSMGQSGGGGMGGMGGSMGSMFGGGGGGEDAGAAGSSDLGEEAATAADSHGGFVTGRRAHKDDGGALDENNPTGQQGNTIDEAPALQQAAPNTSLNSVKHLALAAGEAYLGDYGGAADQVYQGYQSTKQNNANGGRVRRARGGFADGGGPMGTEDDTADPAQDTDVAAAPAGGFGTAAASSDITGGGKPWYKDTGKLIPLAQALAAMGTAPTKHLGVALAAGLGAGATSYQQQQDQLAGQANTQAKTQGQQISNQINQGTADMYTKMLKGQGQATPAPTVAPVTGVTPVGVNDATGYYQNKYAVNPTMLPDEQKNIGQARFMDAKAGTNFTAGAQLDYEQRVQRAQYQARMGAQRDYDKLTNGVVNAAQNGDSAYTNLKQVNPGLADGVARQAGLDPTNQDTWTPQQQSVADQTAAKVAGQHAAMIHQYTGVDYKSEDGRQIDPRMNTAPVGPAAQQLGPAKKAELAVQGSDLVDVQHPDKSISQVQRSSLPGFPTQGVTPNQTAPGRGVVSPRDPTTKTPQPTPNLLPGVDIDAIPKAPTAPTGSFRSANAQQTIDMEAAGKRKNEALDTANAQRNQAQANDALLTQFQKKLNQVNPRDVGPGSDAYKSLLEMKAAITGKAPNDLVDMGVVDKLANQMGVQNVRTLLSGQKITNDEMMRFLERGSASVTQPLDVMKAIGAWGKANNDFDSMAGSTKIAAIQRNADPLAVGDYIDNKRTDFVQGRMNQMLGAQPAKRPGQQGSGIAEGATGQSKSGRPTVYRGGRWEYQ
jgi:hypothetical protein